MFSIIRITVYTVGIQTWIEHKTKNISETQTFQIKDERDITFGPDESSSSLAWINFSFIFPGIVIPIITFYILLFLIYMVLAVLNLIHKKLMVDRDNYILRLHKSTIFQDFLEQNKGSSSSESKFNERDPKFDIK